MSADLHHVADIVVKIVFKCTLLVTTVDMNLNSIITQLLEK